MAKEGAQVLLTTSKSSCHTGKNRELAWGWDLTVGCLGAGGQRSNPAIRGARGGSRAHDLGGPPFLNGEERGPTSPVCHFLPWHLLRPPSSLSLRGDMFPSSDVEALRERLRTAGLDDSIPSESASSSAAGQSSSSSSASSSTASKGDFGQCAYRGGVNCKNTGQIGKDLKRKVNPDDSTDPDDMKRTNGSSYISSMTRGLRYTARER